MTQMTNVLVKNIIKNYNYIIDKLYENRLIVKHNALSQKDINNGCKLEYCTKNDHSHVLYDSSIDAIDLYDTLLTRDQFNIEFIDGSILLFQCLINEDMIIKQRIIFIKPFLSVCNENNEYDDGWEAYQNADGSSNLLSFPLIIRVDYNYNEDKSDHPLSHLTLSNIENCRIPIVSNISFGRFVEFILNQIFNVYNIEIKKLNFTKSIRDSETQMIHLNWN